MLPDLNVEYLRTHITAEETAAAIKENDNTIRNVQQGLIGDAGRLGWFSVRKAVPSVYMENILACAQYVKETARVMIVIGIGGSNRGAMAAIQALHRSISSPVRIVFAGDTLSTEKLKDAVEYVRTESVVLNVIAKDFNTVEPGIAFRVLRSEMEKKYGDRYKARIVVTGSRGTGQLYDLAEKYGYRFLEFPEYIGGRFSVLSPVGLFPMAAAGIDIGRLLDGAEEAERYIKETDIYENSAVRYAVNRNLLFRKGFHIESLVLFEPDLLHFGRWWTQLFAESEGKTQDAVFPVSFMFSEDLHAVGQYVQQGRRCIAETYLRLFYDNPEFTIPESPGVADGFDYLSGKPFDELNRAVYQAALRAHSAGGVPCCEFRGKHIDEKTIGSLFYYFMFSCYVSAVLLKINPFDQEGVENYKKNMYSLLGKQEQS